ASLPQLRADMPEQLATLTAREREVVALVAHGLSNDQIAQRLVVSPSTAKTHVSRAMVKLDAHDRAQLVVLAYQTGLVEPRRPATDWAGAAYTAASSQPSRTLSAPARLPAGRRTAPAGAGTG